MKGMVREKEKRGKKKIVYTVNYNKGLFLA